jgi:hypothetical protein
VNPIEGKLGNVRRGEWAAGSSAQCILHGSHMAHSQLFGAPATLPPLINLCRSGHFKGRLALKFQQYLQQKDSLRFRQRMAESFIPNPCQMETLQLFGLTRQW